MTNIKKWFVFTLLTLCVAVNAKPYQRAGLEDIVVKNDNKVEIDFPAMMSALDNLRQFAGQTPMQFDNEEDKQQGKTDLDIMRQVLHTLVRFNQLERMNEERQEQVILMLARAADMAYYYGEESAKAEADGFYQMLLDKKADPYVMIEYGFFLISHKEIEQAKAQFQAAVKAGNDVALYPLGLVEADLGEYDESNKHLREYIQKYPNDETAQQAFLELQIKASKKPLIFKPQTNAEQQ